METMIESGEKWGEITSFIRNVMSTIERERIEKLERNNTPVATKEYGRIVEYFEVCW